MITRLARLFFPVISLVCRTAGRMDASSRPRHGSLVAEDLPYVALVDLVAGKGEAGFGAA